ncbi:hypothetical protein GIB67_010371 [Kingdonia uniflora]|uniref:Uncharacterized protein n=1 Tax=Kingdonia uniflora TaxID=39325 RepID=A0A7J7MA93_9MAGN|nr:hypothetical protein GIB67_010371 [Kingdonia uniflora]
MKASLKLREDQNPFLRAKVPLNILGFPFQSGVSIGDPKELCLNLNTFFDSGPSFKFSYRPNNFTNPFGLIVKTGIGSFGSPIFSPLAISVEFNFLGNGNPNFSLQFKPKIGDFSIKKSIESTIPITKVKSTGSNNLADLEKFIDGGETSSSSLENGVNKTNGNGGFVINRSNAVNVIDEAVNGVEVTARTVLPIRNRALVKFRWGVKFPEELKKSVRDPTAHIALHKIPFLVMNKISIEHVAEKKGVPQLVDPDDVGRKRQLEDLVLESRLLRKAVEEMGARGGESESVVGAKYSRSNHVDELMKAKTGGVTGAGK